jgi:hypothetical protein
LHDQSRWGDHERPVNSSALVKNAKGRDCLYGLSKTHFVGQEDGGLSQKPLDALPLVGK